MRPRIHYYSDCPFFGGCENMLALFFNDRQFRESFDISFTYRYSPRYQKDLAKKIQISPKYTPVNLFDHYDLYHYIDEKAGPSLRKPLKILINILLIKYIFMVINTWILFRHFSGRDIDLLHINNGGYPGAYSTISAVFAAKLAGVPRIVYVINNLPAGYRSPERWLDYPVDRVLVSLVTHFVTGSGFTREEAIRTLKIPPDRIRFIHNGILPRPVTETRSQFLKRRELPENRFIVSVIANLEERKGHIHLLEAIRYMKESDPGGLLPLCILEGTGPLEDRLKACVREMDIEGHVVFIAHEEHIFNLMHASDCLVLPSIKDEDLPNVILEAMSLGKPVIASDLAGIPEEIDTTSGFLVPPGDYRMIAGGILRLMADEPLRISLGRNAQNRFRENFTHERALKDYCLLYRQLQEGRKA
jgi:glycosyltransferase involved in cell wall biosynthesis